MLISTVHTMMNAKVADATNLSEFTSETFDVVLCLGPMHHLIDRFHAPEEFEVWTKYHLRICREPSILGTSSHALYVCKKI